MRKLSVLTLLVTVISQTAVTAQNSDSARDDEVKHMFRASGDFESEDSFLKEWKRLNTDTYDADKEQLDAA